MILQYNSTSVTLNNPLFGYTVSIDVGIEWELLANGAFVSYDYGAIYDVRKLICTWLLDYDSMNGLVDILVSHDKGRGENLNMILSSGCGFFPFGPDKGDAGTFRCRLLKVNPQAIVGHPEDYWHTECEFIFNGTYPSYSIPGSINEGSLQIGTIENLPWPHDGHEQDFMYDTRTVYTQDSTPDTYDTLVNRRDILLPMTTLQANAARLINHLIGTVRGNDVSITWPGYGYLFGVEYDIYSAQTDCKWPQTRIDIVHENHNRFKFNINFHKV